MSRCWLIILLLLPLVVAQPQDRPVLLAAHRVGRVELLDVDTLQPVGSLKVLPLADRAIIASKEIILLREGLPRLLRPVCARSEDPKSDKAPRACLGDHGLP